MRACYMEHEETIEFLCEKDPTALRIKNSTGQTCMDLASQSLNPLIAKLLEKKYLESFSSSDEFQIGARKRTNYNCNNSNKIVENIPYNSAQLRNKPILTRNQDKMFLINQYETDESTCCKHHCHSDKSYSRYVSLLNLYIRLQENGKKRVQTCIMEYFQILL